MKSCCKQEVVSQESGRKGQVILYLDVVGDLLGRVLNGRQVVYQF